MKFLYIIPVLVLMCSMGFSWYDGDYLYMLPINITEQDNASYDGYTFNITLDTASLISADKMRSDCSDLRVVNATNSILLSHHLSGCNTSSSVVSFRDDISNLAANSYEVYYGYPSASNASVDYEDVLFLFEDFESGNLDNWNVSTAQYVYWSNQSGNGVIYFDLVGLGDENARHLTPIPSGNVSVYTDYYTSTGAEAGGCLGTRNVSAYSEGQLFQECITGGTTGGIYRYFLDSVDQTTYTNMGSGSGIWYSFEYTEIDGNRTGYWNGTYQYSAIDRRNDTYLGLQGQDNHDTYFDNVTVQRAAATEPAALFGSEESLVSLDIYLVSPANNTEIYASSQVFSYIPNASVSNVSNCSFMKYNGGWAAEQTDTNIEENVTNSFTYTLELGQRYYTDEAFFYYVACTNELGTSADSDIRYISMLDPERARGITNTILLLIPLVFLVAAFLVIIYTLLSAGEEGIAWALVSLFIFAIVLVIFTAILVSLV